MTMPDELKNEIEKVALGESENSYQWACDSGEFITGDEANAYSRGVLSGVNRGSEWMYDKLSHKLSALAWESLRMSGEISNLVALDIDKCVRCESKLIAENEALRKRVKLLEEQTNQILVMIRAHGKGLHARVVTELKLEGEYA